jgi:hypothetical protein
MTRLTVLLIPFVALLTACSRPVRIVKVPVEQPVIIPLPPECVLDVPNPSFAGLKSSDGDVLYCVDPDNARALIQKVTLYEHCIGIYKEWAGLVCKSSGARCTGSGQ